MESIIKKSFLTWGPMYSVDIPYIDQQHQELFSIVKDFHMAVQQGQEEEISTKILTRLIQYTQEHFREEEEVLQLMRYPRSKFEAHKLEHERLMEEIFALKEDFSAGRLDSLDKVEQFLANWLNVHILKEDKMYAPYAGDVRTYKMHIEKRK